jgi:tetratricopeptide (TPR) repeat protein
LKETAVRTLLKSAEDQTGDGLSDIRRAIRAKGLVDRHNDHFVGRWTELCRLREIVAFGKPGMITVINGQDGIGKTALATEYSHAFAHEYPGGCWQVPCRDRGDLRVALANMAGARDLEFEFTEEEKRDLDLGLARLLSKLKQRADSAEPSRVLLLLDNVDRPKLLQARQIRQLPRAEWLHVIATTRFLEHGLFSRRKDVTCMTLNALPQGDALALIERFQPGGTFPDDVTREAAHDIVRLLGGFTLAVERAAISVGRLARDLDCAAFRDRLRSAGLSEFEQDDDESTIDGLCHSEACLSATLRPTLEQLGEPERIASIFAALLPADHIALPWVRELTAQAFPDLAEHGSDRLSGPWQDLSQRLFDLRLLQPGVHWHEARMHRLIQKIVRLHAGAETVALRQQELLEHVKFRAEFLWEGWVRKENRWELVPLVALAWHWLHRGASLGVYLANQAFGSLRNLGRFAETEPLIRRALAVEEGSFGLNHPNVATCLNNLATLLHETSRLKEAESIYRRALAIYERSFGPNDARVATCLNNLAQLLQATNRADQAEPLYRRVLAIDEQGFGPNDPKVATHLNNLAQLLQATNRLEEAEALYRRALAVDEHGLGPNHPKVASHLSNLARLLPAPYHKPAGRSQIAVSTRPGHRRTELRPASSKSGDPPQQSGPIAQEHRPA